MMFEAIRELASMSTICLDDIQVYMYHEEDGHLVWEGLGDFSASDVHKQVAISFRTPRYRTTEVWQSLLPLEKYKCLMLFYLPGGGSRERIHSAS